MANILKTDSQTFGNLACEKLSKEAKDSKGKYPSVSDGVLTALKHFCQQSEEFAKTIYESDKLFKDCISAVLKNHGNCLSDIEAYRRAVCFYFEKADVSFEMQIHLPQEDKKTSSAVILNLFDIL